MVNGRINSLLKGIYIIWNPICQVTILTVIPDLLSQIKLRSIGRKPFNIDTPGRNAESGDCRKSVFSVPAITDGRLVFWRPGTSNC